MKALPAPSSFSVPHPEWRPRQYETLQTLLRVPLGHVAIVESACGSGKSAWAAAMGSRGKTIVLTEKKQLQSQYSDIYDATMLMGRNNYTCVNDDEMLWEGARCSDCLYGFAMGQCPVSRSCPYLIQKARAMASSFTVLNYSYANLTLRRKSGRELAWSKKSLVCDESHDLSKICLKHYSFSASPRTYAKYTQEYPPRVKSTLPMKVKTLLLMPWLGRVRAGVDRAVGDLEHEVKYARDREEAVKRLSRARSLLLNIDNVIGALEEVPEDWYISSDGRDVMVKPLTARYVFPKMFLSDPLSRTVCMSATIGNFDNFAEELGIRNDRRQDIIVPSRFPPESRPVYVYKNAPRMSKTNTDNNPSAFDKQADLIGDAIKECPGDWSGLIHVTRKTEAHLLAHRLEQRGFDGRVIACPTQQANGEYMPTNEQLIWWNEHRSRVPNAIMVGWSFGVGYDGKAERINISAKVPYPPFGSHGSYEAAWREYSHERYLSETANLLTQWKGRTRRGRSEDYDLNGGVRGFNAIIDGSFNTQIKNRMGKDTQESLVFI